MSKEDLQRRIQTYSNIIKRTEKNKASDSNTSQSIASISQPFPAYSQHQKISGYEQEKYDNKLSTLESNKFKLNNPSHLSGYGKNNSTKLKGMGEHVYKLKVNNFTGEEDTGS